jgi:N-formylglutamate deformylase
VPQVGGTLIHAVFPRSYTDTNRTEFDIDVSMIDGEWPGRAEPSQRCQTLGNGLIFSKTTTLQSIYDRKLTVAQVQHRIDTCWRPYGIRWHLNLHSMPSNAYERLGLPKGKVLADVVLGDLNGVACSQAFTAFMADAFKQLGYTVSVNDPYSGQDLLVKHGKPANHEHSLQIELNRAVYLNEQTREPLPQFESVQKDIHALLINLANYIQQHSSKESS